MEIKMLNMTAEEMLESILDLAEMLTPGDMTVEILQQYKACLLSGMTVEEAKNKVSWDNSL